MGTGSDGTPSGRNYVLYAYCLMTNHIHLLIREREDTRKKHDISHVMKQEPVPVFLEGWIEWDTTCPNGTPRKLLDVSKAEKLGWRYKTELEDGIRLSYQDFLTNPMRAER